MSEEILVKCENVSKKFCRGLKRSLWYGVQDICNEINPRGGNDATSNPTQPPELRRDEFWAVDNISFELKRGECLGLIGHNGAGKSTLLKMLNGLIKPDRGKITMRGRIGALIELNAGFNPILTGKENVYIYGSILGLTKKEIDRKYDTIVEFAELEDFMEMPFRSYSSGMKVRLGFSVAAQMEPDVLIIDEVLAVGDLGFRIKCYTQIGKVLQNAAVIFVSHNMNQVARICDRAMFLSHGICKLHALDLPEVIGSYYSDFGQAGRIEGGSGRIQITDFELLNCKQDGVYRLSQKDELIFTLSVQSLGTTKTCFLKVEIWDQEVRPTIEVVFDQESNRFDVDANEKKFTVRMPELWLSTGRYSLLIGIRDPDSEEIYHHISNIAEFQVDRSVGCAAGVLVEGIIDSKGGGNEENEFA